MRIDEIKDYEWLGLPKEQVKVCCLYAGDVQVKFATGRLYDITYRGHIVLQEIYFALRDQNWNTIPFTIENLQIKDNCDSFEITFHGVHHEGEINFEWDALIEGKTNGTISYEFKGNALSDFLRNRIGFCVLHPSDQSGNFCRITHSNGKKEYGCFPTMISPHQPFYDITEIKCDVGNGVSVTTRFQGEIFEMEDQRNWTDASFKTYCTPLERPFPAVIKKGEKIDQKVTVFLEKTGNKICIKQGKRTGQIKLGTVIKNPLTKQEITLAEELHLSQFRYEYHFAKENGDFETIIRLAEQRQWEIKLAVFFTDNWDKELKKILELVTNYYSVINSILVFIEGVKVIPLKILENVRYKFKEIWPDLIVGSGTDAFFTQDNREPLPLELMDIVSYSNNPQVHTFDNDSIMSTTKGQIANVDTCKTLFPGLPVSVSPITLKTRWNPELTKEELYKPGEIPKDVDKRQISLFAAAWFIRSLASLLYAGADEAEYFELTGPRGLMSGREQIEFEFPAVPNMIYPVYYAMYFASPVIYSETKVIIEDNFAAIIMKLDDKLRILTANCSCSENKISFVDTAKKGRQFRLNLSSIKHYAEYFSNSLIMDDFKEVEELQNVILEPYEILVLDFGN